MPKLFKGGRKLITMLRVEDGRVVIGTGKNQVLVKTIINGAVRV